MFIQNKSNKDIMRIFKNLRKNQVCINKLEHDISEINSDYTAKITKYQDCPIDNHDKQRHNKKSTV